MARPRGDDWLEDEINHLKNNEVGVLVSLLERDEIYDLKLDNEEQFCKTKILLTSTFQLVTETFPNKMVTQINL